jgi:carbon-monoxide dehydrogenase medium subunit
MYPSEFAYHRATSIAEIGELLRQHPGAKILAGGHSLIPLLKLRLAAPSAVVDIGRVAELKGIVVMDGAVRIGALTTHAELAMSPLIREHAPALAEAAAHVGDPAVRNRGTIGGNVAHADPASDLPCVLSALGARFVVLERGGEKTYAAHEFFKGMMTTAVGEHDLLTAVDVPLKVRGQGMAYIKFDHPASRYAIIGVAAVLTMDRGICKTAVISLGGLVPVPTRAGSVERALVGHTLDPTLIATAARGVEADLGTDVLGDLYASDEYRRAVAHVHVRRAIEAAAQRAH